MERLFLTIITISLIAIVPLLSTIKANAIQSCIEEPDQEPEKTKLLPIVRDQASLQKFSEQEVVVVGRYQRVILEKPIAVSRRELEDPPASTAQKPISTQDLQTSDRGFANIVLTDGTVLPISPRGRSSLRSKSELDKYDGKEISALGTVRSKPDKEINNITHLRLVCSARSTTSDEYQGKKLSIVKTKADSLKFLDNTVQIIGKYVVTKTWNPGINSNSAEFRGVYQQASIELEDGTLIPIMPPYNKLSLRSATEVKAYSGKLVKVVGRIQLQPDNPSAKNSTKSVMLTTFDGIWLK
jgi:hypothetical protein